MSGSLRGDFSRLTFDPTKQYRAVLMQQGRVQVDSDWNEQAEILAERLRTQVLDVIGETGAPSDAAGFRIVPVAALGFDGKTQYLTLGHESSKFYADLEDLRVELLIKPRDGEDAGTIICRFDKQGAEQPLQFSYMLSLEPDGRLRFTSRDARMDDLVSSRSLPRGRWSRVGLDLRSDGCRLSLNGETVGEADRGVAVASDGAFFIVGLAQLRAEGVPGFAGSIREITLSAAGSSDRGPAGSWVFDGDSDDVVLDRSGNGHHAVLGGGSPEASPTLELDDLLISAGRYYVDGVQCSNPAPVSLAAQPSLPGVTLPEDRSAGSSYLVYLDVWERYVAPAQDPALLDPALGGADTSGRIAVVSQVRLLPIAVDEMPTDPEATVAEWRGLRRALASGGKLRVQRPAAAPGTLENRLYRVEIHQTDPVVTWKWSRDNGAVALPIAHLEEGSRTAVLRPIGGAALPLAVGDLVEVVDDHSILTGSAQPLLTVAGVDEATRSVTFESAPEGDVGCDATLNPVVVRWDGQGTAEKGSWDRLELGIDVQFSAEAGYNAGDYWTFTSRSQINRLDWPLDEDGESAALPPRGVSHRLASLALLRFHPGGFELRDCRPVFQTLSKGMVSKAGDRMDGALEIRPGDHAEEGSPSLVVEGVAKADTLLGSLGSPEAVSTFNLGAGAVSSSKLAPDVGIVPPGFAILGASPTAPPGYVATGASLVVPNPEPNWTSRATLDIGEVPEELHSVAVGERIYTFGSSGRVWDYDASDGRLVERRPMPEPRRRFAAAALDDRCYLVGGVGDDGSRLGSTLEYQPETDAWEWRRDMPTPRSDLALAVHDGRLAAVGGLREILFFEVASATHEVYDPLADAWSRRRSLPGARYALSAVGGDQGVFSFGGRRRWFFNWLGQSLSAETHEYLAGVDRWARRPAAMPAPRSHGRAARIGDALFVVGGQSLFGWTGETSRYAPRGDDWDLTATLGTAPSPLGVAACDGRLVALAPGAAPGSLEALECRIATTFHVHRKAEAVTGDLEPQLKLEEGTVDSLSESELDR